MKNFNQIKIGKGLEDIRDEEFQNLVKLAKFNEQEAERLSKDNPALNSKTEDLKILLDKYYSVMENELINTTVKDEIAEKITLIEGELLKRKDIVLDEDSFPINSESID